MATNLTRFGKHVLTWKNCERCELCNYRKQIVLVRGTLPCKMLFVGEAPGLSEDVIGKPFIGPAGKLLDQIIERSILSTYPQFPYAITNLLGCIPVDPTTGKKAVEPPKWAIEACSPRLVELISIASPKVIVAVGKHSAKYLPKFTDLLMVEITHPAAILRADVSQRSLTIQRCEVILADAVESL